MTENDAFQQLHHSIMTRQQGTPFRVAINGIQGTGKTVFASKLTHYLQAQSCHAIHISIDGYHHPRAMRYRQGRDSAQGYYDDCYNETAFVDKVLRASQATPASYVPAIFDLATDTALQMAALPLEPEAILIVDGAFLLKPLYRPHWDLVVYLHTDVATARQRGIARDKALLGGEKAAEQKYLKRYHLASELYIRDNAPQNHADYIFDNSDFDDLVVIKSPERLRPQPSA